ncbi:MAG: HAD hydrolase-like protein [Acidobacteriota bacterium]
MILVLFDIDGTLISTDNAGLRAFQRAMRNIYNLQIEKSAISPDGKTDPLILKEFLKSYNSMDLWSLNSEKKLFAKYLEYLREEMILALNTNRARILPGVKKLLNRLSSQSDFAIGLATGNIEAGARIKLEHIGLYDYFGFGGFSSDSEDRTILTRIGIERGEAHVFPASVDGVFVVGDTPFDVSHGRAAGAWVIAVASGNYKVVDLQNCEPDLVVPDLNSTDHIVSFMRKQSIIRKRESAVGNP